MKQSELYTGQILGLEAERNRSCGRPKTCSSDAIKDDLKTYDSKMIQNCSEWRERLRTANSHTRCA